MDVRVGLWRKLSTEELMLLNCGVREDSWKSLELQGDPTNPFWRSTLGFLWKEWCWSWNSSTLATSFEVLTHWKRLMLGGIGGRSRRGWQRMIAGWHHRRDGREFEWTPGDGDGQGGLACCNSWGHKESDTTEQLNWISSRNSLRDTPRFSDLSAIQATLSPGKWHRIKHTSVPLLGQDPMLCYP